MASERLGKAMPSLGYESLIWQGRINSWGDNFIKVIECTFIRTTSVHFSTHTNPPLLSWRSRGSSGRTREIFQEKRPLQVLYSIHQIPVFLCTQRFSLTLTSIPNPVGRENDLHNFSFFFFVSYKSQSATSPHL